MTHFDRAAHTHTIHLIIHYRLSLAAEQKNKIQPPRRRASENRSPYLLVPTIIIIIISTTTQSYLGITNLENFEYSEMNFESILSNRKWRRRLRCWSLSRERQTGSVSTGRYTCICVRLCICMSAEWLSPTKRCKKNISNANASWHSDAVTSMLD